MRLRALLAASVVIACTSGRQSVGNDNAPAARTSASPFDTSAPDVSTVRALAGCYRVVVGAWSDESKIPGVVAARIPFRIRLDSASHERPRPGFQFAVQAFKSDELREERTRRSWSPVGSDSLQIVAWANQTSSVNLFLRKRASGSLEGTARFFWDQIIVDPVTRRWLWEMYPTAPATLSAVSCE